MTLAALSRLPTKSIARSALARTPPESTTRAARSELPCTQRRISAGFPTVALKPMRWRSRPA